MAASMDVEAFEKQKIFVKGIPISTEKAELEQLFQKVGKVTDVLLKMPKNVQLANQNFYLGFISFAEESSVMKSITQFNNSDFTNSKGFKGFLTVQQSKSQSSSLKMAYLQMKRERETMLEVIEENDRKLKMLEDGLVVDETDLSQKEFLLEKELEEEQEKVNSLRSEIEVLELKLKLKNLQTANKQLSSQVS